MRQAIALLALMLALAAPASAGVAIVDSASASSSTAPLSLSWPKGAPASGLLLVGCVEGQAQYNPVAPTGWTSLYASTTGAGLFGTGLFYKVSGSSEPVAVSWANGSAANIIAAMVSVSGADTTVAPAWVHTTNAATSLTAGPLTPSVLSELALACFASVNGASALTVGSGWTSLVATTGTYSILLENQTALTSDTSTAISVASTTTGTPSQFDAYEVLVAPQHVAGLIGGGAAPNGLVGNANNASTLTGNGTGTPQ